MRFLKTYAALAAPALLAACATPLQGCLSDADRELRRIDRAVAEAEGNLARGFRVAVTTDRRRVPATCPRTDAEGRVVLVPCVRTETVRDETPIPIDFAEERRRLGALRARRAGAARLAEGARRACIRAYPEG
ncbi:MAG: hypothetical protein ACU0BS_05210 [Hasllibacter sp.]